MERIKTFVQKIQEIYYSKHPKSAIDIDLMLDYTRVMYVDLLEWRKGFAEPVHSDIAAMMKENPVENNEEKTEVPVATQQQEVEPAEVQTDESKAEQASQATDSIETTDIEPEKEIIETTEHAETKATIAAPVVEAAISQPSPIAATPELVHEFPEEENIASLSQEHTGISFEAPAPAETMVAIEDTLTEEAPAESNIAVEIPAPAPAEISLPAMKAYEAPKLFDSIATVKDIRTSIGINDKYLFLNELFNNHKSDYEETLDKLNRTQTSGEATEWIKTKVPAAAQWDKNDPTVQSFYALLEKHFAAK